MLSVYSTAVIVEDKTVQANISDTVLEKKKLLKPLKNMFTTQLMALCFIHKQLDQEWAFNKENTNALLMPNRQEAFCDEFEPL